MEGGLGKGIPASRTSSHTGMVEEHGGLRELKVHPVAGL